MESPRFRAILRATSGRRKRSPTDVKSFSHELNSKGTTHQMPFRRLRGLSSPEVMHRFVVILLLFDLVKDDVLTPNSSSSMFLCVVVFLGVFAGDLVDMLENATVEHPEWRMPLEDLLVICQGCAEMSPDELWSKCEGIVQNLDEHRQELPMGTLKQAHTRILFILARCTRLIQFQKEGGYGGNEHVLGLHQLSDLGFYSESGDGDLKISSSAKDMKERMIKKRFQEHMYLSQDFTGHHTDSTASRARISSWKKLPSSTEKNQKKDHDEKDEFPSKKVLDSLPPIGKPRLGAHDDTESLDTTELCSKILGSSMGQLSERKDSADYSGDQRIPAHVKPKMICRICDYEIPTVYAEGHFRACTIADKCDSKGLSIDERLERVAEILEKILVSCTPKRSDTSEIHHEVVKVGASCLTEGSDVPSQCQNHSSSRFDADVIEREFAADRYADRAVPLKSTVGRRFRLPVVDFDHRRSIDGEIDRQRSIEEEKGKRRKKKYLAVVLACMPSPPAGRPRDVAALIARGRLSSLRGETKQPNIWFVKGLWLVGVGPSCHHCSSLIPYDVPSPCRFTRVGKQTITIHPYLTSSIIVVLKKADMIRKNAVKSILAERNILISTRNPFVVSGSVGPTADWWSVGVILFELLVGIPPFNAEHPQCHFITELFIVTTMCFCFLQKIFDNIMNRDIPWPQVPEAMSLEAYDLVDK
ncbi:hypothetical protein GW17_00023671 [Ensete ventricosum]|nr:hypothetical protein GW17_00023671 [Ensete ventricosum]